LGGHSDLIAGITVTKDESLAKRIGFVQNAFGAILGPQDSYLLMRGLKTLKVRMDYYEQSALQIAQYLYDHKSVKKVYYPALNDHFGREIHIAQASGFGAVISFELHDVDCIAKFIKKIKLAAFAVSLGGVESILSYPFKMSHASMPEAYRRRLGVSDTLLRISVGLEDTNDLINDLEKALES
jgi:cystathionine beta-lyase/cystathionine gamma-synthase